MARIDKIIFGLGNPGIKYRNSRHNIGFIVIDELNQRYFGRFKRSFRVSASLSEVTVEDKKILLVKPLTFMNNSGLCFKSIFARYKVAQDCFLVVYDDADLPLGKIRFRGKGASGGQRGMFSIIENLGNNKVSRLKIGIGRPEKNIDLSDYVLTPFSVEEKGRLQQVVEKGVDLCINWVNGSNAIPFDFV